jgi:hypothetical protein
LCGWNDIDSVADLRAHVLAHLFLESVRSVRLQLILNSGRPARG